MHHVQKNIQLKAVHLRNFTIAGHKFKNIPVCERGSKGLRSLFKEYKDALPEDEGSVGFGIFNDIVKLMRMCGESKSGFTVYYIKFYHDKNFLMLCLIGLDKWI